MSFKFQKYGVGAAALALAAAGGYAVRAEQPVNARPLPAPVSAAPVSFADIVEKVGPAVVSIEIEGKSTPVSFGRGQVSPFGDEDAIPEPFRRFFQFQQPDAAPQPMRGAGSGFFISPDGYIATNGHVIENADKITVRTADKRTFQAKVIGVDKATDLAVVKVDARNMPYVSFEDSAKPRVGDWVVAVGNPFGLGGTATAGIVSALNRQNISGSSYVDYMQIDAPINRGNSGGPTFDLHGRVVGVNTAIYSPSGGSVGIGFDIPADVAAQVTQQLIAKGKVSRGYIGASVQDITPEIAEGLGVTSTSGALVADVTRGGPSAQAGLKAGDIVLKVEGREIESAADLTRRVGMAPAGGNLRLEIRRDGKPMSLNVRTAARPSEEQLAAADGQGAVEEPGGLGLTLAPDPKGEGVRVAGVARDSAAAEAGLRPGDVVLKAGGRDTRSAQDLDQAVAAAKAQGRKQVLLQVERGSARTFVPLEVEEG